MKKLGLFVLAALSFGAHASTPVILGTLSNFDVYNHTGGDMEGFEVDLEDFHKSDLSGTWCYGAFGCGVGYDTTSNGRSVLDVVHDGGANRVVRDGGYTHFGVHLKNSPTGAIRYDWLDRRADGYLYHVDGSGRAAAGLAPLTPPPPSPPPPTPPVVPRPPVVLTPHWTFNNVTGMWDISIQNTLGRDIWVQLGGAVSTTAVSLDQLMTDNPLIMNTVNDRYELLTAGESITESEDIQGATVAGVAKFFATDYIGPVDDAGGALCSNWSGMCTYIDANGVSHTIDSVTTHGVALGNIMTAANFAAAVPEPGAAWLLGSGLLVVVGAVRRRNRT